MVLSLLLDGSASLRRPDVEFLWGRREESQTGESAGPALCRSTLLQGFSRTRVRSPKVLTTTLEYSATLCPVVCGPHERAPLSHELAVRAALVSTSSQLLEPPCPKSSKRPAEPCA